MPARRVRKVGGARRRRVVGKGFLDVFKKIANVGKKVIDFVKPTGIISKTAGLLPGIGSQAQSFLQSKGYGRRRRRRVGRPRGGALMRALKI